MGDEIGAEKRALRAELRERRRVRTATERTDAEAALTTNLIALVESQSAPVRSLAAYLSLPDEPPTRAFVRWADDRGIRVLLPVSRADGLLDWAPYEGGDELEDALGMPAPASDILSPMAINDVDLIVVPAASVDRGGMRMGWGLGYFDKTIGSMSRCPPVYAVLFDDEFVDQVPRERHDQPVNGVVTPSAVITI